VRLEFAEGQLIEATPGEPCDHGVRFPPLTFIPVLFGCGRVEQHITQPIPTCRRRREDKLLVETLFPPMAGFVYPSY